MDQYRPTTLDLFNVGYSDHGYVELLCDKRSISEVIKPFDIARPR